jgi:GNAT superfamily N-acetyltransferase
MASSADSEIYVHHFPAGGSTDAIVESLRVLERSVFKKHESLHESIHMELRRCPHVVAFDGPPMASHAENEAGKKMKKNKGGKSAVANLSFEGREAVGYVFYLRQSMQVMVEKVCVGTNYRRRGIGFKMLELLLNEAKKQCSSSAGTEGGGEIAFGHPHAILNIRMLLCTCIKFPPLPPPPLPAHVVLRLNVNETNVAARGLYRKLGFEDRGRRDDYYKPGSHAIKMELEVSRLQTTTVVPAPSIVQPCNQSGPADDAVTR